MPFPQDFRQGSRKKNHPFPYSRDIRALFTNFPSSILFVTLIAGRGVVYKEMFLRLSKSPHFSKRRHDLSSITDE